LSAQLAPIAAPVAVPAAAPASRPTATIAVGILALAASQAGMAAVMGVAGAAVSHAGHGVRVLSATMVSHFIGMFGLSRVVGRFADRAGSRATILVGLAVLASGGLIVALVHGSVGFAAGLMIVGLGWSFSFIGATVLLSDAVPGAQRARTVGRADLAAQMSAAAVATGGGWWFASHGAQGLGLVAIVVAVIPAIALALTRERGANALSRAGAAPSS
jgi:MFS family permease